MADVMLSGRPLVDRDRDAELFVGREAEIARVLRLVARGDSALLHAVSGMGRTSTLRQISRRLRLDGVPVVWLSAKTLEKPVPAPGPAGIGAAFASIRQPDVTSYQEARTRELGAFLQAVAEGCGVSGVSSAPEDVMRALQRHDLEGRVVVVDDMDPVIGSMLFGSWRDAVWELGLAWVVSARSSEVSGITSGAAAAFFSDVVELQRLRTGEARELLRRRGVEDPYVLAAAVENAFPRSPRVVIQMAAGILDGGNDALHARFLRDLNDRLAGLGRPATMLWAELSPTHARSASDPELQKRLGWTRGRLAQVLAELREAGAVTVDEEPTGGRPRLVYRRLDYTTWLEQRKQES